MTGVGGILLAVAALVAALSRRGTARRRLRRLLRHERPRTTTRRLDPIRWASLAAGLSLGLLVDGWLGVAVGLATGVVLDRALRRLESPAVRAARLAAVADLPLALDLLAAAVTAGAPLAVAARTVGASLGGALGERLCRVAHGLVLGAPPEEAWSAVGDLPGAERLEAAAVRASHSGAALAGALTRLADELRDARVFACEAAARRAGVLVVLPLGLCFLPAFVLAGLVPIVVSVLGEVVS